MKETHTLPTTFAKPNGRDKNYVFRPAAARAGTHASNPKKKYTRTHPRKTTDLKKQGGLNTCEAAHLQSCGIIDRLF